MSGATRIKGVAASIGVAVAPARMLDVDRQEPAFARIDPSMVSNEMARFAAAIARSRAEIERAKTELTREHGPIYAPILDVYLLMHGDALLIDAISEAIRRDRINAEWAVTRVCERLREPLLRDSSAYFRERADDIEHVRKHLLRELRGDSRQLPPPQEPVVLVAHDLSPADAVRLLAPPTLGLVTELGAGSSHTAIVARTFGVPAVVGVGTLPPELEDGETLLVDGFSGEVVVGVSDAEREEAERRRRRFVSFIREGRPGAAVTRDGVDITVAANVELPSEVGAALQSGAEGIGLFRSELMCLDRSEPPSEDEQYEIYRSAAITMAPQKVLIRTFDWRGDKRLRARDLECRRRAWLMTQVKAVLRASVEGSVALMFPMVATVEDFLEAKALVAKCRDALGDPDVRAATLPVGMMVEVPAAALLADRFAQHADFFAVGTNDLAHSTLAIGRGEASSSATALEPAVLRLVSATVTAAEAANIPCSLCGDMAADPLALGLAAGLGFRAVSVPVSVVSLARAVIRNVDLAIAREVADKALEVESATAVRTLLNDRFGVHLDPLGGQDRGA